MPKDVFLNIRLDPSELEAIKRAAREDQRPPSALARLKLVAWLKQDGWLTESAADPPRAVARTKRKEKSGE